MIKYVSAGTLDSQHVYFGSRDSCGRIVFTDVYATSHGLARERWERAGRTWVYFSRPIG